MCEHNQPDLEPAERTEDPLPLSRLMMQRLAAPKRINMTSRGRAWEVFRVLDERES